MATLVFTISELVEILQANDLLPEQISEVEARGHGVALKVKTGMVLFKTVPVDLEFAGFEDGVLQLKIIPSRFMAKFERAIGRYIESLELPPYISKLEYPHAYVDVNHLLTERAKGISIQHIAYDHGQFHINTADSNSRE